MFPEFAIIMLAVTAVFLLVAVAATRVASKKMKIFMKVMKASMGLNILLGIIDLIAVIVYFM